MKKGFTLLEIMISFAIIAVIATVSFITLNGRRTTVALTNTAQGVAVLLRQAQADSLTQKQGKLWGVHFDNTVATAPFYSLFYTSSNYAAGTETGHYALPAGLCYATSSVSAGSSVDVIFSSLSGGIATSTNVVLQYVVGGGCVSATSSAAGGVSRTAQGEIFFDDFSRSNL